MAFTGEFDGNQDVYVVPAAGGELKRLTAHPGTDVAVAWSPDGQRILFRSSREAYSRFEKLFTVPVEGGFPTEVPVPMGVQGAYSADAARLAYVPRWNRRAGAGDAYIAIKNYRGGKTSPIWIAQLADSAVTSVPRENSNDFNPLWIGDKIYFLSDRAGATTLFSYDVTSRAVVQLVKNDGFDLKSAAAGPGGTPATLQNQLAIVTTPPSVAQEPMFADIVKRAKGLKAEVETYRQANGKAAALADFNGFSKRIASLSEADMNGHLELTKRGVTDDLKCILRGISQDLPLKLKEVAEAKDAKTREVALRDMSYLLNDNVEVITAPPQPAA